MTENNTTTASKAGPNMLGMLLVHRMFRNEFAALAGEAPAANDQAHIAAVEDQLGMVLRILHEHHTGEDTLIWPLLLRRAPGAAGILGAMEAEHGELDPLIRRAGDASLPLASRARTLSELSQRLDAHLAREETEALPLAEANLTNAEWASLDEQMIKRCGKDLPALAGAVLWHATPGERDQLLSSVPRILGIMWRLSWRRRYARRHARVYRRPPAAARNAQA